MVSPVAATVDVNGISAPDFAAIQAYWTGVWQGIYGEDIYLGNDSQDGQLIAAISQAFADSNAAAIGVYNNMSPATAVGNGLSSVVKINGLKRLTPSFSTAQVTIVGVATSTTITNGVVTDSNNNQWALPPSVTIPSSGSISVTATCTTAGAIAAGANTITGIATPVYGWQTVTNPAAAVPGAPVEPDPALRGRQSVSTSLPAQTIFAGIVANILNSGGVTRAVGYENNTGSSQALTGYGGGGLPAHTLAFVVEGGIPAQIFNAIALTIPPGIGTAGAQTTEYVDSAGSTRTLAYGIASELTIDVVIVTNHLPGWSSATEALIQAAIVAYINSLPIGTNVSYFAVAAVAQLTGTPQAATFTIASMTLNTATTDVAVNYNQAPTTAVGDITVS